MPNPIHVYSEIGRLQLVMLHRPGQELENLEPAILNRMLIDDIPYLKIAQAEHDLFAQTLQACGAKVVYLEDLLAQSLTQPTVRQQFVDRIIGESGFMPDDPVYQALEELLLGMPVKQMISQIIAGVRKDQIKLARPTLADLAEDPDYPFYLDPMPNVYFTRDQQAAIGDGLTINRMTFRARRRESLFMQTIAAHHPDFAQAKVPIWRQRSQHGRM